MIHERFWQKLSSSGATRWITKEEGSKEEDRQGADVKKHPKRRKQRRHTRSWCEKTHTKNPLDYGIIYGLIVTVIVHAAMITWPCCHCFFPPLSHLKFSSCTASVDWSWCATGRGCSSAGRGCLGVLPPVPPWRSEGSCQAPTHFTLTTSSSIMGCSLLTTPWYNRTSWLGVKHQLTAATLC